MSIRMLATAGLLAGGLTVLGCSLLSDKDACSETPATPPPAGEKTAARLPENRRNEEGFLLPEYWPKTVEQAVDLLITELSPEDKRELASTPREDLIGKYHFGLGMSIRNDFGLWSENSDLLRDCALHGRRGLRASKEPPSTQAVAVIVIHPDGASGVILEALWDRLQRASD